MKRIITLTISILLLFGSLSACTQNVATAHSEHENIPEVNWYYEFFSDMDDTVAITDNRAVLLNKGMVDWFLGRHRVGTNICSSEGWYSSGSAF